MKKLIWALVFLSSAIAASAQRPIHRVVIEVNTPGTVSYSMVLGNAENLIKAMAPEPVQIEIVCLGGGINMLFANKNPLATRMNKDRDKGVWFAACSNTLHGMHIDRSRIFPFAKVVDSGVAEVVRREEQGWSYLKGGF